MEVIASDKVVSQLNRFKNLSEYDIEDFVQEEIESEDYQDFLNNCNSSICNEFYDRENNVTIFSEVDFDRKRITVTGIRRGNLVGKDFI